MLPHRAAALLSDVLGLALKENAWPMLTMHATAMQMTNIYVHPCIFLFMVVNSSCRSFPLSYDVFVYVKAAL
jgi:hypothetical protein